ncbi:3'-5' exoribonuclease [Salmonella enterica subsp. enterica]|nr:3'-5' exoribonuclease [Salmonella enterica subsp. enterica]
MHRKNNKSAVQLTAVKTLRKIPMKHLMIDLETMDNKTNRCTTSIGAARFNPETAKWKHSIVVSVLQVALITTARWGKILCWWLRQSIEAKSEIINDELSAAGYRHI